ncbi:MAG: zinc ribbon domain-containing protein [Gemmatimonadota bacterium]|nr:zinc ribbon domain-containing protein [Gemmatimonadota bacterium]
MPTYAYTCPSCGHEFQKFHKMSVKARPKCPECGAVAQRQITGGSGFLLKGSGFYSTDYRTPGDKADRAEKAEKADKTDKGDKGEKGEKADKPDKPDKTAASASKTKKRDSGAKGSGT